MKISGTTYWGKRSDIIPSTFRITVIWDWASWNSSNPKRIEPLYSHSNGSYINATSAMNIRCYLCFSEHPERTSMSDSGMIIPLHWLKSIFNALYTPLIPLMLRLALFFMYLCTLMVCVNFGFTNHSHCALWELVMYQHHSSPIGGAGIFCQKRVSLVHDVMDFHVMFRLCFMVKNSQTLHRT